MYGLPTFGFDIMIMTDNGKCQSIILSVVFLNDPFLEDEPSVTRPIT